MNQPNDSIQFFQFRNKQKPNWRKIYFDGVKIHIYDTKNGSISIIKCQIRSNNFSPKVMYILNPPEQILLQLLFLSQRTCRHAFSAQFERKKANLGMKLHRNFLLRNNEFSSAKSKIEIPGFTKISFICIESIFQ